MNVYSNVSKIIFAGMTTFALSSVAVAESEETTGLSDTTQDEIQDNRSGQDGMKGKNSASHEELNKGMNNDSMSENAMGMEDNDMQSMEDDAPVSTTDQEGMAGKDSANHDEKIDEGM